MWLVKRSPCARNYLGLEIRLKLVKRADCWIKGLNLNNIYFVLTNAAVSFARLVSSDPAPFALVSILVFVQSDVLDVAIDIKNQIDAFTYVFQYSDVVDNLMKCDPQGWLLENPFGKRTEREIHAELEGAKIYRRMYHKRLD